MPEGKQYILGTDRVELERLRQQHQAWVGQMYAIVERAGVRGGHAVLDLGCGPGYTSFELAHIVGAEGRVHGRDMSEEFVAFLRAEARHLGLGQIEASVGPVEELELPAESFDAAYSRWLFSWLPDPAGVLAHVSKGLRPGGVLVLQEYLDWTTLRLLPRDPLFDRTVATCYASFGEGGRLIDVAEHLGGWALECGLGVEDFQPIARIGRVGGLEWGWLGGFFASYLPRLVERGLYSEGDLHDFLQLWAHRSQSGHGHICAPTLANLIFRKS